VSRLRVAAVMPPSTIIDHAAALELWPTFTGSLDALRATGEIDPIGCCRTISRPAVVTRRDIEYYFEPDEHHLALRVAAARPDVVHIHGLGFTRLLVQIRRAVGPRVPILMQHHGEAPPTARRSRFAQRLTRRLVAGYLFTGAADQAEPFRQVGVISRSAPAYEVLESASYIAEGPLADGPLAELPALGGDPCVLWVGRLIPSKDPLCAVRAIAEARRMGSAAELHMLVTDRSMEAEVRVLVESMDLREVVHLHPAVDFAEISSWYRRADVYLSTSHREGSNYSLIEALGLGCRPIVTEIPSHAAIVQRLAQRFAVGDSAAAGTLLAAPYAASRDDIITYSRRHLAWANVAEQLAGAYRRSLRS
jgi:glycosyltransferase involved in cell wall biosynthesis